MAKRAALRNVPELEPAPSPEFKLDLGCGENARDGYEGVDRWAKNAKHKVDLFKFPLPWADNSVDAVHCAHFLEHIPAREVETRDVRSLKHLERFEGQDFLCAFMDECWRILKPDAIMTVIVPCGKHDRGFQDPTHRRFFVKTSFAYFWKEWREQSKLDHYLFRGGCNFASQVTPGVLEELTTRHEQVQAQKIEECWNVVFDWHVTMKAIKS